MGWTMRTPPVPLRTLLTVIVSIAVLLAPSALPSAPRPFLPPTAGPPTPEGTADRANAVAAERGAPVRSDVPGSVPTPFAVTFSSFKANRTAGSAPLSINATAVATGGANATRFTFAWTFSDGATNWTNVTATAGQPATSVVFHNYTSIGVFQLYAKVTDNLVVDGSQTSRHIQITATDPLTVDVTSTPQNVTAGNQVTSQATASGGLPPYRIVSWSGAPGNCVASAFYFNCTPSSTGAFTLRVTISDAAGNVRSANSTFRVFPALTINAGQSTSYSCSGGTGTLIGNFTAITTGGTPTPTVVWSFGDGTPNATGSVVSHQFVIGANYTVVARATDPGGGVASESFQVVGIYPPCGTTGGPSFQPPVLLLEIGAVALAGIVVVLAILVLRSTRSARGRPGGAPAAGEPRPADSAPPPSPRDEPRD